MTESGRTLYEAAVRHLGELEISLERMRHREAEVGGVIRLTAPDDFGVALVASAIDDFRRLYPDVKFDVEYSNEPLDLLARKIDVAVRIGRLRDSQLRKRSSGRVRNILVAAPQLLGGRVPSSLEWQDIEERPAVAFAVRGRVVPWSLVSGSRVRSLKPNAAVVLNNYLAVRELTVKGAGVALLPQFLANPLVQAGSLVHLKTDWSTDGVPVQVLLPHQKEVPRRIEVFSKFMAERLIELLK